MKINASKFRRRWAAAIDQKNPRRKHQKMDYLVMRFHAEPVYRGTCPAPVAWRLPTGDVFCMKKAYPSPQAVDAALANLVARGRRERSWYRCPTCHLFHMTSRPQYVLPGCEVDRTAIGGEITYLVSEEDMPC